MLQKESNINQAKQEKIQAELISAQQKLADLELANLALTEGIWMLHLVNGDADHKDSRIEWSIEFRKLLGYERASDFPNGWDSWANVAHPDDKALVLTAFSAHLSLS